MEGEIMYVVRRKIRKYIILAIIVTEIQKSVKRLCCFNFETT